MSSLGKVIRALLGLVVIAVVAFTIYTWYGDFKVASLKAAKASKASTPNIATATVVPVQGQHAIILAEGVQLHASPAAGTKVVRTLKKGETLLLVGISANNWMQLRDGNGKFGYVANTADSVKVQK